MNTSKQKQQGMTLLEVLVATSILAVIGVLAFASLDNLTRSKQSLDEITQALNQDNLAYYLLQTDLQLAIAGHAPLPATAQPDFIGTSQGFTLVRYRNAWTPSGRENNRGSHARQQPHPLVRVRWYVRNNQWIRATQSAFKPLNSNHWVERPMMALQSLNCSYRGLTGVMQPNWPNSQLEQNQLPESIHCQWHGNNEQNTVLQVVPWQKLGFL